MKDAWANIGLGCLLLYCIYLLHTQGQEIARLRVRAQLHSVLIEEIIKTVKIYDNN